MKLILFPCLILLLFACQNESTNTLAPTLQNNTLDKNEVAIPTSENNTTPLYEVKTFQKKVNNWGYQILQDGKLFINQPHIPSMQGNKGFSTEEKAIITANYVITKLKAGIMPPTLTVEELDSLSVLN